MQFYVHAAFKIDNNADITSANCLISGKKQNIFEKGQIDFDQPGFTFEFFRIDSDIPGNVVYEATINGIDLHIEPMSEGTLISTPSENPLHHIYIGQITPAVIGLLKLIVSKIQLSPKKVFGKKLFTVFHASVQKKSLLDFLPLIPHQAPSSG